jgi:hypothetical protein
VRKVPPNGKPALVPPEKSQDKAKFRSARKIPPNENRLKCSQINKRVIRKKDSVLNVPFHRTATGQRSFLFTAVKLWNDLPDHS